MPNSPSDFFAPPTTQLSREDAEFIRLGMDENFLPTGAFSPRGQTAAVEILKKFARESHASGEKDPQRAFMVAVHGRAPEVISDKSRARFALAFNTPKSSPPIETGYEKDYAKVASRLNDRVQKGKLPLDEREKAVLAAVKNGYLSKPGIEEHLAKIDVKNDRIVAKEKFDALSQDEQDYLLAKNKAANAPSSPDSPARPTAHDRTNDRTAKIRLLDDPSLHTDPNGSHWQH